MNRTFTALALLAGLSLSGAAKATLLDRGGEVINDDVLNVTWLQDATVAGEVNGKEPGGLCRCDCSARCGHLPRRNINGAMMMQADGSGKMRE